MEFDFFPERRKSFMEENEIYFWTATINHWQPLLWKDEYKNIIVDSLNYLTDKNKIEVYGFVIMPNHIHLIWRMKALNGKETAHGSFLKWTAHEFQKLIADDGDYDINTFRVNATNKKHEFWQRDSLAIRLFTRKVAFQKLNYIHNNPCTEYWKLALDPTGYFYSSARLYEFGERQFAFLKDLREVF